MATTTIRIDDSLKIRVSASAEQAGKTTHAFIMDAIASSVEQAEQNAAFENLADERWAKLRATGHTVAWDDAKAYLIARANGDRTQKPTARKLKKSNV